jgi:hypothetical protein
MKTFAEKHKVVTSFSKSPVPKTAKAAAKIASDASAKASDKAGHKEAGEAHLKAAELYERVGANGSASAHKAEAAKHAEAAGGEWDESKHPRGADGKFS